MDLARRRWMDPAETRGQLAWTMMTTLTHKRLMKIFWHVSDQMMSHVPTIKGILHCVLVERRPDARREAKRPCSFFFPRSVFALEGCWTRGAFSAPRGPSVRPRAV
jgi:hypothetical protein